MNGWSQLELLVGQMTRAHSETSNPILWFLFREDTTAGCPNTVSAINADAQSCSCPQRIYNQPAECRHSLAHITNCSEAALPNLQTLRLAKWQHGTVDALLCEVSLSPLGRNKTQSNIKHAQDQKIFSNVRLWKFRVTQKHPTFYKRFYCWLTYLFI